MEGFMQVIKHTIGTAVLLACWYSAVVAQSLYVPPADNTTYEGKVMFGYQGWFGHPDDQSARPNYWHWGNLSLIGPEHLNVEMYPDLREFCSDEKYSTAYTFADGRVAPVFSSGNRHSVMRHIKWVRDYSADGVFVQRFISEYGDPAVMQFRDEVTGAVMEASELYDRVFGIMYDGVGDAVDRIKADWMHLVDDVGILESPAYLHHEGRPLVTLWGFTFYENATLDQLEELIDWFHEGADERYRASVKLGLNDFWFTYSQDWLNAFAEVEVIMPWPVGRYSDPISYLFYWITQINPGKSWCDNRDILYVPAVYPGFSWTNLKYGFPPPEGGQPPNAVPRKRGNFYWMQSFGALSAGARSVYIAMLDELDEATAMFKVAENAEQTPDQGYWLDLDDDGYTLPSDWYLRCAKKTAETVRGRIPNSRYLGNPPEGIMTLLPNDSLGQVTFVFPDFTDATLLEISLDGGMTYPYSTPDNAGSFTVGGLANGTYEVFVRYPASPSVPMGEARIFGSEVITAVTPGYTVDPGDITVYPNPSDGSYALLTNHRVIQVQVYNANGEMVMKDDHVQTIHLDDQPAGIYLFRIYTSEGINTKKVLKK